MYERELKRRKKIDEEASARGVPRTFRRLATLCGWLSVGAFIVAFVGGFGTDSVPFFISSLLLGISYVILWLILGAIDNISTFALVQLDRQTNRDQPIQELNDMPAEELPPNY
ncbi:MAG: hypothetical protein JJU11_00630 [Candidatus Sumerlaeia bacterium]|nr:hypothetical protein [Candidatus Sumerlaeia bacterium]